ncbi:GNAT family N-acetyltransferase [Agrobacterium rosae]|uniref:GNAT family N-acetyltransferase n=1 Tax=Agrobacterium rosae TaxID=1972867 RepID=A0AAW9FM49_9HYPH|nr:GNAT family N-acetyltransferase [Agrobacterium rosae]MDX8304642.1 GNAT family N-acetyltransferase [Agrobacterium rosae]
MTRSQVHVSIAVDADIDFISKGFSTIKPLASSEGASEVSAEWLSSTIKSQSNPIYQLWQFAVATIDFRRVGFIQTMDFELIRQPLLHQASLGFYSLAPGLLSFSGNLRLINAIYVDQSRRNNGVGKALIESQQARFREKMGLLYSEYNSDHIKFYRSLGFLEEVSGLSDTLQEKDVFLLVKKFQE